MIRHRNKFLHSSSSASFNQYIGLNAKSHKLTVIDGAACCDFPVAAITVSAAAKVDEMFLYLVILQHLCQFPGGYGSDQ
ncbi:hypothetical protein ALO_17096 [Acetonema longum DSM 6540]|uniref:Uncharacterized protein n=1 Tax=Acetonema longum DSM 6540 TaxID=1009370 RepID=F7NMT8_9FIRM|nr:hypothetical protein ALO_17096 [Acetonema longum DSM 6540]